MTLTLTLDRVILHTVMRHSSTSTYIPNFIEIEETFVDGRTDGHLRPTLLGRPGGVHLKSKKDKRTKKSITKTGTWRKEYTKCYKLARY